MVLYLLLPNMKRVQNVGTNKLSFSSLIISKLWVFCSRNLFLLKSFQLLFLYMKVTLYMLYNSPKP